MKKVIFASIILAGCTVTQNPDGSQRVNISIPSLTQPAPATSSAQQNGLVPATPRAVAPQSRVSGNSISNTKLANIYRQHPWDGSDKPYFPRIAITVKQFNSGSCWVSDAVIWWSQSKSEKVSDFSVCPNNSLGAAINGAAGVHIFMGQSQPFNHTGNVRSTGPKPPQYAISMSEPTPEGFVEFTQQLLADTGWQAGPSEVTMWIVGFNKN